TTFVRGLRLLVVCIEWLGGGRWYDPRGKGQNDLGSMLGSVVPTSRRSALYDSNFRQLFALRDHLMRLRDNVAPANMATLVSDPSGFLSIIRSAFRPDA